MEACAWHVLFSIVLIRTPSQKKGCWFRGARFHHVPGEPNKRWGNSKKRLGKVGVSRHDVENVNLTTCSHPSLCIRADSQEIGILFPIHLGYTWLYGRTLKTTVWTACNVSFLIELEILLYWFNAHMLQRWKPYQSLHHRNLPILSWIHTHPYCIYRHTIILWIAHMGSNFVTPPIPRVEILQSCCLVLFHSHLLAAAADINRRLMNGRIQNKVENTRYKYKLVVHLLDGRLWVWRYQIKCESSQQSES